MPSYYRPGTRRANRFYIVRGRIDGREYEIRTRSTNKTGAEDGWADFKYEIRLINKQVGTGKVAASGTVFEPPAKWNLWKPYSS